MKKLSQEEIQNTCSLYKTYGSLRKVSKISSRSLGIVHKYTSLHSLIKKQNIVEGIFTNNECLIGTYVGLWLGDGTQYNDRNRHTIKICSNKNDFLLNEFIQRTIFQVFWKNTRIFKEANMKP